jgi:hypothetical protein
LGSVQPGTYTLVTFATTSFAVTDFSYTAPPGITGDFLLTSNSLQFQVVPEPAMALAFGAATLVFLRQGRSRRI